MKTILLSLSVALLISSGSLWAQAADPQQRPQEPVAAQAQAQAQSWSGTLADAACKMKNQSEKCPVEATTAAFGLVVSDGKFYRFDDAGNAAAAGEVKKASNKSGEITATVTGALDGETIKVQSVQLQ